MTPDPTKYYERYVDRYSRIYAQGVSYWTGNPDEVGAVLRSVDEFLSYAKATPASASVVEFGCGEGFLGEHLLAKGYSYLGIDIAPSALAKARARAGGKASAFMLGDVTRLIEVRSDSFTVALDNYCLHMLVTDEDRKRCLSEIERVLTPGGHAWFHEIGQATPFTETIHSLEQFLAAHPIDLDACEAREAFTPGGKRTVQIPRLPARFNNGEGYRREIESSGLKVDLVEARDSGIVVYARKAGVPHPPAHRE